MKRMMILGLMSLVAMLVSAQCPHHCGGCQNQCHQTACAEPKTKPAYPGGKAAMWEFVDANRQYPADAQKEGVQGRCVVFFIVETDGSLSNVEVGRSSGDERLDREAVRIVQLMPRWTPAQQGDKPVRVRYALAIPFELPKE